PAHAAVGARRAEGGYHLAVRGPLQLAAQITEGGAVGKLRRDVGEHVHQRFHQFAQGLLVALQLAQLAVAVADARVHLGEQPGALVAGGFQRGKDAFALGAHAVQVGDLLRDLAFEFAQSCQLPVDAFDARGAGAVEIVIVGEHAAEADRVLLVEQQLHLFLAAGHVGGAHLPRERVAFRRQPRLAGALLGFQRLQALLLELQGKVRLARGRRGPGEFLLGAAQLGGELIALAEVAGKIALHALDARAQRFQFFLLLLGIRGCARRNGQDQQRAEQDLPHAVRARATAGGGQPHAAASISRTSGLPVIWGGISRPIRCSSVGAMSDSAPPGVSSARRPRYTSGTRLVVCAVCGWPVASSYICSTLPWSAVISISPPALRTASARRPRQTSSASTAFTA